MNSDRAFHGVRSAAIVPPRRLGGLEFPLDKPFPETTVNSCLALYLTWYRWIPRKYYRFRFLDTETVVHHLRWEFHLPADLPVLPDTGIFVLPVAVFERGLNLMGLNCYDDGKDEVSLLTQGESDRLLRQMRDLALRDTVGVASERMERDCLDAGGYLQFARMSDPSRLRRSLTLEYETKLLGLDDRPSPFDQIDEVEEGLKECYGPDDVLPKALERPAGESGFERLRRQLSLDSSRLAVTWPISGLGDCYRARIECEPPAELEIANSFGFWRSADGDFEPLEALDTSSRAFLVPAHSGTGQDESSNYANLAFDPKGREPTPTRRGQPGFITVVLRPRWDDIRDAFVALGWASVMILLVAAAVLIFSNPTDSNPIAKTSLATVVAFTASISTSVILRPNSHEIAGFLLRPVRVRLAVIGLLPILAAITIAIPLEPRENGLVLVGFAVVELLLTEFLCRRPLDTKRDRLKPILNTGNGDLVAFGERAKSMEKTSVKRIQRLLGDWLSAEKRVEKVRVTGRFDRTTVKAVTAFQKAHKLEEEGRVERATVAALTGIGDPDGDSDATDLTSEQLEWLNRSALMDGSIIRIVRDIEMFRGQQRSDQEQRSDQKREKEITEQGLVQVAREHADRAGWKLGDI